MKTFDEQQEQINKVYDEGFTAGYEYAWNEIQQGALEPRISRLAALEDMDES